MGWKDAPIVSGGGAAPAWASAPVVEGGSAVDQIPGVDKQWAAGQAPAQNRPAPSVADRAIGAGEVALTIGTGATGGALGLIGGTLKGLAEQILSGQFGTQEAARLVEQSASQGMQALTYAPRTPSGQAQTEAVGRVMQQALPIMPLTGELATAARGAPAAVTAVGDTARAVPPALASAARKVMPARQSQQMGGVGAAAADVAAQRAATAQSMPVPIKLTKGQASRDPAQLKFEVETAKMPEEGARLRMRTVEQNEAILKNIDSFVDQIGAEAPNLRAVGVAVDKPLVEQLARDKNRVRVAYKNAEKAGELEAPVQLDALVQHLNDSAPDAATAPLLDVARRRALQLGVAAEGEGGTLVPQPVTLKAAETYRQAISRATDYEATNVRQSTLIKGYVDQATEGLGGNLYREARALRARMAQNYENRGTIAKLVETKRGTTDRQVAFEDVFDHTILRGSLDDVRNVRRVLHRSGADGQQAWRELQGATMNWIKDQATRSVATDGAGNRVVSVAGLDKAIRTLDHDGRLEFIFSKKGAQQLRDLNDLAAYVKTVPPEAGVNTSNTAATLLAAFADVAFAGMSGAPVPITTVSRMALRKIKDAKLRRRISDALDEAEKKQAPGKRKPPISAPPTVH